jgi:uncharacterized protein
MLLNKIRTDMNQARQTNQVVAKNLLVTLYSESARVGKDRRNGDPTDAEVVAVVKRFLDNAQETRQLRMDRMMSTEDQTAEIAILESYMPRQLGDTALRNTILEIVASMDVKGMRAMGAVMNTLKERHGGSYDGAKASSIVKQVLSGSQEIQA